MDFATLSPEINSARMYSGAGSGPMLAAATAWDGLATELHSTAASYGSVVSGLTNEWQGPSSASMAAAAAPYVTWMQTTAAQVEQAAAQAKAAAGAYEAAFVMTVPPPAIAANRAQLMALVATNVLGQNTPAIAANEALYGEMWAQDAAAMYGYAGSSAAATTLTPFTPPPPTANPAAPAHQAAAVGQTTGVSAATKTATVLSQLTSVPTQLQGLASPLLSTAGLSSLGSASAAAPAGALSSLAPLAAIEPTLAVAFAGLGTDLVGTFGVDMAGTAGVDVAGLGIDYAGALSLFETEAVDGLGPLGGMGALGPLGSLGASASLGQAASVGALSVPPSWTAAAPELHPVAVALANTSVSAAPESLTGTSGNVVSEMALAGMAGRALAGTVGLGRRDRLGGNVRRRAEPPQRSLGGPITGIAAELRELAELRDSGILTEDEFTEQKRRLLGH